MLMKVTTKRDEIGWELIEIGEDGMSIRID